MKNCGIFLISAQKIDCGCTLEIPHCGGSNEYPQSMFESQNIDCWYTLEPPQEYPQSMFESKNKKNMYTPVNPIFTI